MPPTYRGRMALFADRAAAGDELSAALTAWKGEDAVVCGILRGGVPVAARVARALGLALTAVAVRKLGAPWHPEVAIGAIAEGQRDVDAARMRSLGVSRAALVAVERAQRRVLAQRSLLVPRDTARVRGRTAIVVDDGVATGSTAVVACRRVRADGAAAVVLAVPVAPADWEPPAGVADAYVCPHRVADFWAVGAFYTDFAQTRDEEVRELLRAAR